MRMIVSKMMTLMTIETSDKPLQHVTEKQQVKVKAE